MKERTFKKPEILHQMLYLRLQGWPLKELAILYSCDHTSIRKACLRSGLPPEIILLPKPLVTFRRVLFLDGERINPGKSYEEYRKEQEVRRQTPAHIRSVRM